jgi:membrane protein involved in colicin uptake
MPLSDYSEELQQRIKQAKTVNERSKIIRDSDEHKQRVATQGTRMAAAAKQRKADIEQQRRNEATQRMNQFVEATKNITPQQLAVEQKKGNAILAQRALEKKADAAAYAKQNAAFEAQKNKEDAASAAAMKAKNLAITRAAGIPDSPDVYKKGGPVKSASSRADGCAVRGKTRA